MDNCMTTYLGMLDYQSSWDLQKYLAYKRYSNVFLLLEHPHTITLGRRGVQADITAPKELLDTKGITVHYIDRGGEVTYHGPGQLIGYPILDLRSIGKGPLEYVRALEQVLLLSLADLGISSKLIQGKTGVWVDDKKIGAIGVKVSRGVTTHGFALNINTCLEYFDLIVPCGMPDCKVTSIEQLLQSPIGLQNVIKSLVINFEQTIGINCVMVDKAQFYETVRWPLLDENMLTPTLEIRSDINNG